MTRKVAIVSPLRTPIGRFLGALQPLRAEELAAHVIRAVVERSGIDPERIEDVVFAQGYANSEAPCIGRWAALAAGLPIGVPGMQLDRRCGGGLQSVATAAMMVSSGTCDVVLAGGVESMSNIEYYTTAMRGGARSGSVQMFDRLERGRERSQPVERFGVISGMIETAENLASDYSITREASDALAARSHQRAAAAWDVGRFDAEVVPVSVPQRKGEPVLLARDEGVKPNTTVDSLTKLRPIMHNGTVTAGNSSGLNDGAALTLIASEKAVAQYALRPMARVVSAAVVGVEPRIMGIGPVEASNLALKRAGLSMADMEVIELNEAFAAQSLACIREWGLADDDPRINPNGGAIAIGHPLGMSGTRIAYSAALELVQTGKRYALVTMCIGVGQGYAAVLERA